MVNIYNLKRFSDNRGFFQEIYRNGLFEIEPKQVNWSFSIKNTIRGLHLSDFDKLITCIHGQIYDVAIDMRKDSETYLKQFINILDSNVPTSVCIPSGFAHGFMALTDATIIYLQSDTYRPENEKSIHYSFVEWPKADGAYIISEKDGRAEKWI